MTTAPLALNCIDDLATFFASIETCRDKRSFTHSLHPYPAKFIPEIPRALLRALGSGSGVVLDPMCGSGTTLVEATLAGYEAVGVDLNPIATVAAAAKTTRLTGDEKAWIEGLARYFGTLSAEIREDPELVFRLVAEESLPAFLNRDKWFAPHVLYELQHGFELVNQAPTAAASVVVVGAFSAGLVAASNQESETRWCAKPRNLAPGAALGDLSRRFVRSLAAIDSYAKSGPARAIVMRANARALPVADESVDVVITSPPYANSHDYYLYNKLRLFWLGHDVRAVQEAEIGSRNRHSDRKEPIETYLDEMGDVLTETSRTLRDRGKAAFVVADAVIRGEFFNMRDLYIGAAADAGLRPTGQHRFSHQRLNALFPDRFGTRQRKTSHVLVFEKPAGI